MGIYSYYELESRPNLDRPIEAQTQKSHVAKRPCTLNVNLRISNPSRHVNPRLDPLEGFEMDPPNHGRNHSPSSYLSSSPHAYKWLVNLRAQVCSHSHFHSLISCTPLLEHKSPCRYTPSTWSLDYLAALRRLAAWHFRTRLENP